VYVSKGMDFILSKYIQPKYKNWQSLFEVIIWCVTCNLFPFFTFILSDANKPSFFTRKRPFRSMDIATGRTLWDSVNNFTPGSVYAQGSLEDLHRILGVQEGRDFTGSDVLYMGDHLYTGSDTNYDK